MIIKIKHITHLAVAIGILLSSKESFAATITANFTVSATVTNVCTVNASTLDFSSVPGNITADVLATNTVTVQCNVGTTFYMGLNQGGHSTGGTNMRMASGPNFLNYQIYSDSARTQIWGTPPNGLYNPTTAPGTPITATGIAQSYTGYGKIPSSQNVPAGAYTDTVTVTVDYT